ncbi:MAG TPA: tetraacyldisaccharide 4'-kinase [Gemmatimonadaceae bacterium]|nr:tetraacyldisaccharide 4'-kinase [Gemmatimonadaceae bacterium]
MRDRALNHVWESGAPDARLARAVLAPFGWAFGAAVAIRNLAYDRAWLPQHALALPAIAVGNLTVGGTGKTPVSAWLAARLRARGARPAIVLRGYGGDEPLVHARLNPDVLVLADADRVRAAIRAREAGATVVVLDDGFQHRRAKRDADLVLLSADRFGPVRLLPAGPWREPLAALGRASAVVVTRKSASRIRARELLAHAMRFAPRAAGALVHLPVDALVACAGDARRDAVALAGTDVLAITAIADARPFESQLRALGARVQSAAYDDHHLFTVLDAEALARRATRVAWVVCTLKDAVKLEPVWPRAGPPLWYLSQRVSVEAGADALEALIAGVISRTAP